jgi:hypothetical protein
MRIAIETWGVARGPAPTPTPPAEGAPPGGGQGTVRLRTALELLYAFRAVTGIEIHSRSASGVASPMGRAFDSTQSRISIDGSARSFIASNATAVSYLISSGCKDFIAREAALPAGSRRIYGSVNFSSGISAQTTNAWDLVADRLYTRFLQRTIPSAELTQFREMITEVRPHFSPSLVSDTQKLALVTCVAVAGSLEFIANP